MSQTEFKIAPSNPDEANANQTPENLDETEIEIKQANNYKPVCRKVMHLIDIIFYLVETVLYFYILVKIVPVLDKQWKAYAGTVSVAATFMIIALILSLWGKIGQGCLIFKKSKTKDLKCCAKILIKNAYKGMLVPLEMLYLRVVGHDEAIIGTTTQYFIWAMYVFSLIVLCNPVACINQNDDSKPSCFLFLFALASWALNLFILVIEVYVGFPSFIDKLISTDTIIELSDAFIDIPAIAYLSSE